MMYIFICAVNVVVLDWPFVGAAAAARTGTYTHEKMIFNCVRSACMCVRSCAITFAHSFGAFARTHFFQMNSPGGLMLISVFLYLVPFQQYGTILDVEIIFNERGSKVCSFIIICNDFCVKKSVPTTYLLLLLLHSN